MPQLLYRRPTRASKVGSDVDRRMSEISGAGCNFNISGIPDRLSLDRILKNATCPPMTCRDFMNYLTYIEHGAENLQFLLWFRHYVKRFDELPESEKALSPPYVSTIPEIEVARPTSAKLKPEVTPNEEFESASTTSNNSRQNLHPLVSMASAPSLRSDPFSTPPATPNGSQFPGNTVTPFDGQVTDAVLDHQKISAETFAAANVPQPFTIQPFRNEISRVIAVYLTEGAPRELNLSASDRTKAIRAIAQTTHPSALEHIHRHVEDLLRFQSHPNFIRWSICNGNRPRVIAARCVGTALILIGFIIAILLTLGSHKRGYRAFAAIPWVLGIATLWAAIKGMCVLLHVFRHRHLRPWELWVDDEKDIAKISIEVDDRPNSYEDEPWVKKYKKRFIIRRVFDREVRIEEPALRAIQSTVFLQGILMSLAGTIALTAIFLVLPAGNYF